MVSRSRCGAAQTVLLQKRAVTYQGTDNDFLLADARCSRWDVIRPETYGDDELGYLLESMGHALYKNMIRRHDLVQIGPHDNLGSLFGVHAIPVDRVVRLITVKSVAIKTLAVKTPSPIS